MKQPLLVLKAAAFGYNTVPVVENVSLKIEAGDFVLLTGVNGSGKTTIFRGILGTAKHLGGTIRWYLNMNRIGYVPQETLIGPDIPVTALDIVRIGVMGSTGNTGSAWSKTGEKAICALRSVGMAKKAETRFGLLSGGQKRRTLLAKALVRNPLLLILDEPTANVDQESKATIAGLLQRLTLENDMGVLATGHSGPMAAHARQVYIGNRTTA